MRLEAQPDEPYAHRLAPLSFRRRFYSRGGHLAVADVVGLILEPAPPAAVGFSVVTTPSRTRLRRRRLSSTEILRIEKRSSLIGINEHRLCRHY